MCGRYASFREAQDLADAFHIAPELIAEDARGLAPSWNVAPTDPVRIVVERTERALRVARWGLVPSWAKDPKVGSRMINARVETIADKPAFRKALASRRALVPAEGYYEWDRQRRQPYWMAPPDGSLLAFAGLYEFWRDPSRDADDPLRWLVTMTIVTRDATGVHDRRPVVLDPERWDAWLDPQAQDAEQAVALLAAPGVAVVPTPVSKQVNRVGNDGPELIRPATT